MVQMRREEQELDLHLIYLNEYNSRTQPRQNRPQPRQSGRNVTSTGTRRPISRAEYNRRMRQKRIARRRRQMAVAAVVGFILCIMIAGLLYLVCQDTEPSGSFNVQEGLDSLAEQGGLGKKIQGIAAADYAKHPTWEENHLTVNEYSRPGDPLKEVKNIFVHYTANPGTSAAQNRSYFENLKDTHETSASAHFVIGYEGEIIQCIPMDEMAYAVASRNEDSISIECCYLAQDGSFTEETYESLIKMLRWLIDTYDLTEQDILRHYDEAGKMCPLYYAENENEWEKLKQDVADYKL